MTSSFPRDPEAPGAEVQPYLKTGGFPTRKGRKRLPARSPKRIAEAPLRAAVRDEVLLRDGFGCVAPGRGLPGPCGKLPGRMVLEVHEVESRGTNPGSHLDPDKCVTLCPVHHSAVTSATGEALELARSVGLVVRPST